MRRLSSPSRMGVMTIDIESTYKLFDKARQVTWNQSAQALSSFCTILGRNIINRFMVSPTRKIIFFKKALFLMLSPIL